MGLLGLIVGLLFIVVYPGCLGYLAGCMRGLLAVLAMLAALNVLLFYFILIKLFAMIFSCHFGI